VLSVADGNDLVAIEDAIKAAKADTTRPTLIRVRTVIGYGTRSGDKQGPRRGAGNGGSEGDQEKLGWPEDKSFYVPDEARANWETAKPKGKKLHAEGTRSLRSTRRRPERLRSLSAWFGQAGRGLGEDDSELPSGADAKKVATRNAGQVVMNAIAKVVPERFGGAADITASTKTIFKTPQLPCGPVGGMCSRRARVRHDGDGERDGSARRADSVWLDVLRLLGLL